MRVAILRRAPKASVSMDVYADKLAGGLRAVRPTWTIQEYSPNIPSGMTGSSSGLTGIKKYYERYWRFPNTLKNVEADVFHIIDHSDGYLSRRLRRNQRTNVVTCHDLINLISPETYQGRARFPLISLTAWRWGIEGMRQANHVVTVSRHTKQDVIEHLNIEASRITVTPNAVDKGFHCLSDDVIASVRARYKLAPEHFCLLNVGSNNVRKNISAILAVIAQLKSNNIPIQFWKAGADFNSEQKQFMVDQGLNDCVSYVGQPDETTLIELYNAADCLIAPSLSEGFGLTILEAMACGTPVITSNVTAMPEVAGEAAILVDPTKTEMILQAVEQLYHHPEERQMLKQKGLVRVQHFTWEKTAEQVAQVYERLFEPDQVRSQTASRPSTLTPS